MARLRLILSLLVILAAVVHPAAQQPAFRDPRLYRSGVELTSVNATVRDTEGRLIAGLPGDAFDIYEDGELQRISQFTNERVPVSLGVLLDVSDSMFGRRIKDARSAVERFLFDLLGKEDEYFVMTFNHRPHALTSWTSTPDLVRQAMADLRPTGGTAVYDAAITALPMFQKRSRERAALVIISDGADTASDASIRSVRSSLVRNDAFVYAVAIDSPDRRAINTRVNPTALQEITDDSGGRTEIVHSSEELAEATARIAEELNTQYLIGYVSTHGNDGQFHTIRVRVRGTDYRVRARSGYVAAPPPKSD